MSESLEELIEHPCWGEDETLPVVVQTLEGEVVTLAYMNREALRQTLARGCAHYYSRSKGRIRMKGEVSGNVQRVEEIRLDCDGDALLMKVEQRGSACHTGHQTCFYRKLGEASSEGKPIDYSLNVLKELEAVIRDRKARPRENSYTSSLFQAGLPEIQKKLGEEAVELLLAQGESEVVHEAADFLYHFLVLLGAQSLELSEVMAELRRRRDED
ncbi:MAG: bifunctional phosphoribosyl-AMP cyclohydrolase/phosphoribosyl-ATP diphosphatase HisIE [Candidatus Bipolaricaulota bacterium]